MNVDYASHPSTLDIVLMLVLGMSEDDNRMIWMLVL